MSLYVSGVAGINELMDYCRAYPMFKRYYYAVLDGRLDRAKLLITKEGEVIDLLELEKINNNLSSELSINTPIRPEGKIISFHNENWAAKLRIYARNNPNKTFKSSTKHELKDGNKKHLWFIKFLNFIKSKLEKIFDDVS